MRDYFTFAVTNARRQFQPDAAIRESNEAIYTRAIRTWWQDELETAARAAGSRQSEDGFENAPPSLDPQEPIR